MKSTSVFFNELKTSKKNDGGFSRGDIYQLFIFEISPFQLNNLKELFYKGYLRKLSRTGNLCRVGYLICKKITYFSQTDLNGENSNSKVTLLKKKRKRIASWNSLSIYI